MSWNPFKKALFSSRKPKKDNDDEFEYEIQRLRIMQSVCKRLYKGIRQGSELELAMTKTVGKMAYDLKSSPSCKQDPLKSLVEAFVLCADTLQVHTRSLYANLDTTFYDPLRRFRDTYKHLEFHVKQREARLQDVEKQQAKLDKRRSSSSISANKLELTQRKLASRKGDYDRVQDKLMNEMPRLFEGRVEFFKPCLAAMMQSQYLYHHECSTTLNKTLSTLNQGSATTPPSPSLSSLDDYFRDIRNLSIVGEPS